VVAAAGRARYSFTRIRRGRL